MTLITIILWLGSIDDLVQHAREENARLQDQKQTPKEKRNEKLGIFTTGVFLGGFLGVLGRSMLESFREWKRG